MRAVVVAERGRVEVADVADPMLKAPTDAIVRVTRAAICGSDLHVLHGKVPVEPGETVGHEAVGIVEEVGAEVAAICPGDRVVLSFLTACGACWFCSHGETALCDRSAVYWAGAFGSRTYPIRRSRSRLTRSSR